jgi:hypothetical protein
MLTLPRLIELRGSQLAVYVGRLAIEFRIVCCAKGSLQIASTTRLSRTVRYSLPITIA